MVSGFSGFTAGLWFAVKLYDLHQCTALSCNVGVSPLILYLLFVLHKKSDITTLSLFPSILEFLSPSRTTKKNASLFVAIAAWRLVEVPVESYCFH